MQNLSNMGYTEGTPYYEINMYTPENVEECVKVINFNIEEMREGKIDSSLNGFDVTHTFVVIGENTQTKVLEIKLQISPTGEEKAPSFSSWNGTVDKTTYRVAGKISNFHGFCIKYVVKSSSEEEKERFANIFKALV